MQTIVRAQAKLQQATLRTEAGQRRHDSREWVMRRKERTRHLIELGGLVQKAGLVDLTDDDRATLYGAMLELAGRARGEDAGDVLALWKRRRSEEHTSELQSLMRTSYAVLCLKNTQLTHTTQYHQQLH